MSRVPMRQIVGLAIAVWLVAILSGFLILQRYANTPGEAAAPPVEWPVDSGIVQSKDGPTLLVFAHPHCPCTRATLRELKVAVSRSHGQLAVHVLFVQPQGVNADWLAGDLWKMARHTAGLSVFADIDGLESRRFRVATSGTILLYEADGTLKLNGGITTSRGHEGDNPGRETLIKLVCAGDRSQETSSRHVVFGCPLLNSGAESGGVLR